MKVGKFWLAAAAFAMILVGVHAARAQGEDLSNATCQSCHGQPGFSTELADGQTLSLFVSADHFANSVHRSFQCTTCHTSITEIPHKSPPLPSAQWRQQAPKICGTCHTAELSAYLTSIHGNLVTTGNDVNAAVCTDCHTAHAVGAPTATTTALAIIQNCGNCHKPQLRSYLGTFHGQVATLGYTYIAKCYDCHGNHTIEAISDPKSTVYPSNRLATCQKCHKNATAGFITFEPHATTNNFARYPYSWLASKFMYLLLGTTFALFSTHSAFWLDRELRDRSAAKHRPHVRTADLLQGQTVYYQRWSAMWRLGQLAFAIAIFVLILTGVTLYIANSFWALAVQHALGGPRVTGWVHRIFGVALLSIFFAQLGYVGVRTARNWRTFRWFGPTSMIPNLQDFIDVGLMFKWFVGVGPKPLFDKWTYWEKFDYWAPFWGVAVFGVTGVMLWFTDFTASILPGWVFNVAPILHGWEAVLEVFVLVVWHFFNNHWRPENFPLDIRMFTGVIPVEKFRREHTLEYNRLVASGRLADYIVDAPSRPMTVGSQILGFFLVGVGLILLIFIEYGVVRDMMGG